MGYTHYFDHKKTTKTKWKSIKNACKVLSLNLPKDVLIDGCLAHKEPVFDDTMIWFNGTDKGFTWEDRKANKHPENGHETFVLEQKGSGDDLAFCKTGRKPYDLLVCACLLVYKHYSPTTIKLSSDGNAEDWKDAEEFVLKHLGIAVKFE